MLFCKCTETPKKFMHAIVLAHQGQDLKWPCAINCAYNTAHEGDNPVVHPVAPGPSTFFLITTKPIRIFIYRFIGVIRPICRPNHFAAAKASRQTTLLSSSIFVSFVGAKTRVASEPYDLASVKTARSQCDSEKYALKTRSKYCSNIS